MGEYRIAFGLGLSLDFCLSRFVERFPCIALAEKTFPAAAKIFTSDGVGAFPVGTLGAYNRFVGFCGDFRPSLAGGLFPALLYCRRALFGAGSGAGSCGVFGKAGAPFGRFALVLFLGDAGVLALGSLFKGNLAAGTFALWFFDPAIVVDSALARTASFANFDLFFCAGNFVVGTHRFGTARTVGVDVGGLGLDLLWECSALFLRLCGFCFAVFSQKV